MLLKFQGVKFERNRRRSLVPRRKDPKRIFLTLCQKSGCMMNYFRKKCDVLQLVYECEEDDVGVKGFNRRVLMTISYG